jgi:heme/copper-type cytochrome/quinol oxidase subunit 2
MAFAYVPLQSFDMNAARNHDIMMYRLWWASVAVWLVSLVIYLVWLYRVNENCRALAPGFNTNSILVLVSYFIPLLNLAYPCLNMQEIWRASTHPAEWKHERSSTLVGLWWGFSLANGGMGWLLFHFPPVTNQATLWNISIAMIVFECLGLVLGVIGFLMVFRITANQNYQLED